MGIATTAMISGTTASNEAKTKASTISAPTPPITVPASTPGPSLSAPASSSSASRPVTRTGSPATSVSAATRSIAASASGFSPNIESGEGGECTIANVVRPSGETKVSSPVEA